MDMGSTQSSAVRSARWLRVLSLLALVGCTEARPVTGRRHCATWTSQIARVFAERCSACHGTARQEADYRVASYLDALGQGRTRGLAVIAGDARSPLLTALEDTAHEGVKDLLPLTAEWVVSCEAAYRDSDVHAAGIMNPATADFHGRLLAEKDYAFSFCEKCHGGDLSGGAAQASCLGCHPRGPKDCSTCHALPPPSGSHLAHARGPLLGKSLDCGECHVKPTSWSDPGHIRLVDGTRDPAPAEVALGPLASTPVPRRMGAPSFADGRCTNVYCHGSSADGAATNPTPRWGGAGSVPCGACHGLPPADHPVGACTACHPRVVDEQGRVIDKALHLDGRVSLGDDSGTCRACHPDPGGPHRSHTEALHGLSEKIACTECHQVPATLRTAGHLDGRVEVFPVGAPGSRARAFSAKPTWSDETGRCADVHCHGGGTRLGADVAVGIDRTPAWTVGSSGPLCGSCHGVPPVDGLHQAQLSVSDCATCHPTPLDPGPGPNRHINGVVDVR